MGRKCDQAPLKKALLKTLKLKTALLKHPCFLPLFKTALYILKTPMFKTALQKNSPVKNIPV